MHDFNTKSTSTIESELSKFSKQRKMELILPCLYSELEGTALPKIVEEISKTKYLDHIIIGLDKANESQAKKAWKFFKKLKSPRRQTVGYDHCPDCGNTPSVEYVKL